MTWDEVNELHEATHRAHEALLAGPRGGVSEQRLGSLLSDWQIAHRVWWDAAQDRLAEDRSGTS